MSLDDFCSKLFFSPEGLRQNRGKKKEAPQPVSNSHVVVVGNCDFPSAVRH